MDENYQLRPGTAGTLLDLEVACCAQDLRHVRGHAEALFARLLGPPGWQGEVCAETLCSFRERADSALDLFRAVARDWQKSYLDASRQEEAERVQHVHRVQFIDELRSRLTYAGSDTVPSAWSLLGWIDNDPAWPLAISRDCGHVILASGIQGHGKTLLSTLAAEGTRNPGGVLSSDHGPPTALCSFYIEEHDRLPQILDGLRPNPRREDLQILQERLNLGAQPFDRIRFVAAKTVLDEVRPRLLPYEDLGLEVAELRVRPAELGVSGIEAMLGADDGTWVVHRLLESVQKQGRHLSVPELRRFVNTADDLNATMKRLAHARLDPLDEIAGPPDGPSIWDMFGPNVATAVYLGGPHMGRGKMAPILVGLLNGLLQPSAVHGAFHRMIVVDEVDLLAEIEMVWKALIAIARMVRHRAVTLMLMGQDLLGVPNELWALAGIVAVFRQRNPMIWEHIRARVGALRRWGWDDVSDLDVAWALLAVTDSSAVNWRQDARRVKFRPPLCQHGGFTRKVV